MQEGRTSIAAAAVAAFALRIVGPAEADCGPTTDPSCRLTPLPSRQVNPDAALEAALSEGTAAGALRPVGPGESPFVSAGSFTGSRSEMSQSTGDAGPTAIGQRSAVEPPASTVHSPSSSTPTFPTLDLTMRYQTPGDVSCGVLALGMPLDGLDGQVPSSSALLNSLRGEAMLYDFGTGIEELAYAPATYGYAQARPVDNLAMADLQAELAAGRPVVVALGPEGAGHFVTITGLSADGGSVAFNDPTLGPLVAS